MKTEHECIHCGCKIYNKDEISEETICPICGKKQKKDCKQEDKKKCFVTRSGTIDVEDNWDFNDVDGAIIYNELQNVCADLFTEGHSISKIILPKKMYDGLVERVFRPEVVTLDVRNVNMFSLAMPHGFVHIEPWIGEYNFVFMDSNEPRLINDSMKHKYRVLDVSVYVGCEEVNIGVGFYG